MPRYLILTDAHFGTPESAMNDGGHRALLVGHLVAQAPWDEIVLGGDLLDANLSTLGRAIEGDGRAGLCGFRQFLAELHAAAQTAGRGGLPGVARRWVYVPGNHDYKIWDLLATRAACEAVLQAGAPLGSVPMPLQRGTWTGAEAFIAGVWKGEGWDASERVSVAYPDHPITFGAADLIVTHGHYLDASQTRFSDLAECLPDGLTAPEARRVVREVFIETAQYQTVANAVSFTRDTHQLVSALFGPAGLWNRVEKLLDALRGLLAALFFRSTRRRRAGLSRRWLRNVDAYVAHFLPEGGRERPVRWFVFGHTHRQGAATSPKGVAVWNAGSCYLDRGRPVTFLQVEAPEGGAPAVRLRAIARAGGRWAIV